MTLPEPAEEPSAGPAADGSGTAGDAAPGKVSGGRRGRRGVDAFLEDETAGPEAAQADRVGGALALPSGRRRAGEADAGPELAQSPVNPAGLGTGRRRGRAGDVSGGTDIEGRGTPGGIGGPTASEARAAPPPSQGPLPSQGPAASGPRAGPAPSGARAGLAASEHRADPAGPSSLSRRRALVCPRCRPFPRSR